MSALLDRLTKILNLDLSFIFESILRNGVAALTEYSDLIAKMNALASESPTDFFELGR